MKTLSVFPAKGLLRIGCAATLSMPRATRGSAAAPPTKARLVMPRPGALESDVIVASFGCAFAPHPPGTRAGRFVRDPSTAAPAPPASGTAWYLTSLHSWATRRYAPTSSAGKEASKRPATETEIAKLRRLVLEVVRGGAIGFATLTHEKLH